MVVLVDNFGNATAAAYGLVPQDLCPIQVANEGEDYAIAMLAQIAFPPSKSSSTVKARSIASEAEGSRAAL